MATVNLELYEALKKTLDEEAARMIAEVVPEARNLATKEDLERVEHRLERRIDQLESRMFRWTLTFFVPLWVAVLGTLLALVLNV